MNAIENYTQNVLKNELLNDVKIKAVRKVINDIENRLKSLISHWNDEEFRRVILVLGKEEALHYHPLDADLEIKSLVVVGIRNSLFEDLQENELARISLGVDNALRKEFVVRKYTESAIRYFSDINLEDLSYQTSLGEVDVFGHIPSAYPVAWDMMKKLSDLEDGNEVQFEPIEAEIQALSSLVSVPMNVEKINPYKPEVLSAVCSKISPQLYLALKQVEEGAPLVMDSFKILSRNTEKFFKVLEYVIRQQSTFVTNNVLIRNGLISSRNGWIRPMHTNYDNEANLKNTKGLKGEHKELLKGRMKLLKKAQ